MHHWAEMGQPIRLHKTFGDTNKVVRKFRPVFLIRLKP